MNLERLVGIRLSDKNVQETKRGPGDFLTQNPDFYGHFAAHVSNTLCFFVRFE